MSKWTAVNASIRYDGTMWTHRNYKPELGTPTVKVIFNYEDVEYTGGVPCGSEGSLQFSICNIEEDCTVSIWGNLRDYTNVDELLQYFKRITVDKVIRSGILEINLNGKQIQVYRYHDDRTWLKVFDDLIYKQ